MNEDIKTITINFDSKDILKELDKILKSCIDTIHYGLKLNELTQELPDKLNTEEDFFHFQIGELPNKNEQKQIFKKWLLFKGFEDTMKGINLMLIDAYFFIKFWKHLAVNAVNKEDQLSEISRKIKTDAQKLNIPTLIRKIEEEIGESLNYKKEILSINNARNCFVHRDGIVDLNKDINNKDNTTLQINWIRFQISIEKNGKFVELYDKIRVEGETTLRTKILNQEKSFLPLDKIDFSFKQYKDMISTCFIFGKELSIKLGLFTKQAE